MKKIFPIAVISVLVVGGGIYFTLHKSLINEQPSAQTVNAIAQLKTDLSAITTSQFIKREQTLMSELQKIHDDVLALLIAQEPNNKEYFSQFWLTAVGKRYILVSQPSAGSSYDEIIDSQTGKISYIPNGASYARFYLAFEGGNDTALYIGNKDIYTYMLDQSSFVIVPGSKLSGGETYHSGKYDSPTVSAEQTHTDTSITISAFDSLHLVPNPESSGANMYKKVRDVTIPLQ